MKSFSAIATFVGFALASPVVERDTPVSVTICMATALGGECMTPTIITQQQCLTYGGTIWDNNMRSIDIPDGFRCRFWDSNHCDGSSTPDLYGPGTQNVPGDLASKATSFKCYQN
ncbi:hypothetical protein F4777DRAFT_526176 [Nemania sp. FL0916]|nr:hypothetical protein F4777DRAFT_526176 [Nemania sp. FL0916]